MGATDSLNGSGDYRINGLLNPQKFEKSHDNSKALDYSGSWRFGLRTTENRAIRRRFGRIIPLALIVFSQSHFGTKI